MRSSSAPLSEPEMLQAWRARDASYDGRFVFGVTTTGIFCRPSCPSRPLEEHVRFFPEVENALRQGFRPCRRCTPDRPSGEPPDWIRPLLERAMASPGERITSRQIEAWGLSPERVRRWFQANRGQTFASWHRGLRLSRAKAELGQGASIDDAVLSHGFESHSGFRSAFHRAFGSGPGRARSAGCLMVTVVTTPLGPMLAAADDTALCHLQFADLQKLPGERDRLSRRFGLPVVAGENRVLEAVRNELDGYFAGRTTEFTVPFRLHGTPFQKRVWTALQSIPSGSTWSYADLAREIGSPTAVRAVARANATNPVFILVPCHRVIGKDGRLSGYAGGVWRKERLLQWEHLRAPQKANSR